MPRLSYYLGKGDKEAYVALVNRGSRIFNFFIIPLSFGLMVLGPNAILLYGSEKYIGGGILTSLFAFRTIILALDHHSWFPKFSLQMAMKNESQSYSLCRITQFGLK